MSEKPYVLVVDDDVTMRELSVAALGQSFRAVAVESGEDALTILALEYPDAILLDVDMSPGIDGYETCRRIKADAAIQGIPVV